MKIVIAGPGALGGMLAARLSTVLSPEDELTLLAETPEHAARLNSNGFVLEDSGSTVQFVIRTTADPADISGCDLFFLCTRSADVSPALDRAAALLTPDTLLIGMQRGVSHLPAMQQAAAVPAAVVTSADVFQDSSGRICCLDPGSMNIGFLEQSTGADQLLDQAVELLERAGLQPVSNGKIEMIVWDGFMVDLAVNALAAIYRRPNGQLLTSCSVRGNLKKLLLEAAAVAEAEQIPLSRDPVKAAFHFLRTAKDRIAPMLRDVRKQQGTEIDALNGSISVLGRQFGIPTPVNDDLVQRIKKLEEQYV